MDSTVSHVPESAGQAKETYILAVIMSSVTNKQTNCSVSICYFFYLSFCWHFQYASLVVTCFQFCVSFPVQVWDRFSFAYKSTILEITDATWRKTGFEDSQDETTHALGRRGKMRLTANVTGRFGAR